MKFELNISVPNYYSDYELKRIKDALTADLDRSYRWFTRPGNCLASFDLISNPARPEILSGKVVETAADWRVIATDYGMIRIRPDNPLVSGKIGQTIWIRCPILERHKLRDVYGNRTAFYEIFLPTALEILQARKAARK